MVTAFIVIVFLAIMLIPFIRAKWKGIITITTVCILCVLTGIVSIQALLGISTEYTLPGTLVTGEIAIRADALSAWFILTINFTFFTGALYGFYYMKAYKEQTANLSFHCIAYILVHSSLISICLLQNSLVFLFVWEIMALASFVLVIFEHHKQETLKAGINFLIQAHVCILFLMVGFIWVISRTNSFDFKAISDFSLSSSRLSGLVLFLCFFVGFAIKAGFVPFHTWLPYAHPAAPSHVSGVMSGVIIKIGIYGILRMLLLITSDYTTIGYIILIVSVISGIYGVMLAIIQHNLKKLLAYHSIENIGIIGIGIGLGSIGMGTGNKILTLLGFSGALLHTLNHSLFKSILFYAAGNVYQATHTMNIERLGGIIKPMPHTAVLFLIAAVAICGLPPFNGFVSEFLIYNGMFSGFQSAGIAFLSSLVLSLFGLVLIGGLAILCFTKAFGTVFLGSERHHFNHIPEEAETGKLIPMYLGTIFIIAIGLFPKYFIMALSEPVSLYTQNVHFKNIAEFPMIETLSMTGICSFGFIVLSGLIFLIRKKATANKTQSINATWGCGYVGPTNKMQYTASSFIRTYRKLAKPVLSVHKKKKLVQGVFPIDGSHETHPYDKSEEWLIDYPLKQVKYFFNRFIFLQNGNAQFYILYGVVFIVGILGIPVLYYAVKSMISFLNQI